MPNFYTEARAALEKAITALKEDSAGMLRADLDLLTKDLNSLVFACSNNRYGVALVPDKQRKEFKDYDCYRFVIVDGPTRKKIVLELVGILIAKNWRYPCGLFSADSQPAQIMNVAMLEQFFIGAYLTLPESPVVQLIVKE